MLVWYVRVENHQMWFNGADGFPDVVYIVGSEQLFGEGPRKLLCFQIFANYQNLF